MVYEIVFCDIFAHDGNTGFVLMNPKQVSNPLRHVFVRSNTPAFFHFSILNVFYEILRWGHHDERLKRV